MSSNSIRGFCFLHTLSSICYLYRLFDDGHSDQSEVIPHCGFDLHFSNNCHFLLQGIFPTQGLNPGLPHCRQTLYHLSHQGSWIISNVVHLLMLLLAISMSSLGEKKVYLGLLLIFWLGRLLFVIELHELVIPHILLSSYFYLLFSIATSNTLVQPSALSLQFSSAA